MNLVFRQCEMAEATLQALGFQALYASKEGIEFLLGRIERFERDRMFDLYWDLWSEEGLPFPSPYQPHSEHSGLLSE